MVRGYKKVRNRQLKVNSAVRCVLYAKARAIGALNEHDVYTTNGKAEPVMVDSVGEVTSNNENWSFLRNKISLRLDYYKRLHSNAVGYALHTDHRISTNLSPITGVFWSQVQTCTQSKKQTWPTKSYQIMGERVKVVCNDKLLNLTKYEKKLFCIHIVSITLQVKY